MAKIKKSNITYGTDFVLTDMVNDPLEFQSENLLQYLPGWKLYKPFGNKTYQRLFSPIYEVGVDDIDAILVELDKSIENFMLSLNSNNQTISRIDCTLECSDEKESVVHIDNGLQGNVRFIDETKNRQKRYGDWIFSQMTKFVSKFVPNSGDDFYGNQFVRETNDFKVSKKYYCIVLDSPYRSL